MAQSKLLLDSNAYFRLAPSIHPLLFVPFGEEKYCLYVIDDFEKELKRSQRLKSKFAWALQPEFIKNREHHITISNKQKKEIVAVYDFMWNSFKETGVSPVDVKAIAVAYVLKVELISDDIGVQNVAKEYDIPCRSTVNLLHVMFKCKHICVEKVRETIEFLQYEKDTCASYRTEYESLFEEPYPVFKE